MDKNEKIGLIVVLTIMAALLFVSISMGM